MISYVFQHVPRDVYWYYVTELAFYWGLVFTLFVDHRRKVIHKHIHVLVVIWHQSLQSEIRTNFVGGGGSICNENPFITPSTNTLGFYAICQTKDQSVAVIMVHETLFYLSKFN